MIGPVVLRLMILLSVAAAEVVTAAPGAHGPNGEHLESTIQSPGAGSTVPRIEAMSESFELVGRLAGAELSLFINRYETSDPVLDARVEVEFGQHRAVATFHPDHGDYSVTEAGMLAALARPGEHSLVISLVAGADADLLEGTLRVPDNKESGAGHRGDARDLRIGLGVLTLLAAIGLMTYLFRRRTRIAKAPARGPAR